MVTKSKTPAQIEAAEKRAAKTVAKKAEAKNAKAEQNNQPSTGEAGGADNGEATEQGAAAVAPVASPLPDAKKRDPESPVSAVVIGALHHDSKPYDIGDPIELSQKVFLTLEAAGVVEAT